MKLPQTSFCLPQSLLAFGIAALAVSSAFAQEVTTSQPAPSRAEKVQALKATSAYGIGLEPAALGDFARDNVYTAITPCRVADTRNAGGQLAANATRTFDVDGTNFTSQGGNAAGCGIPFGVPSAVVMTLHVVGATGVGALYAWGLGSKPIASAINYIAGQTIASTTIVPVVPGTGNDFSISSQLPAHVVIDAIGYFSEPIATPLECINAASAATSIPPNVYTAVDAICPATYAVTGGGTFPLEGTLGRPNIWTDGSPTVSNGWRTWVDNQTGANRSVQTYARCCRVPGR